MSRPHVVTHLFADGGRIIKSTRTEYSEHVGRPDMAPVVRRLMKEQHKAMFIALRDGQFDELIARICGPAEAAAAAAAPPAAPAPSAPEAAAAAPAPHPTVPARRAGPNPTLPEIAASDLESASRLVVESDSMSSDPVPRRPAPTLTDLVLADLESARSRSGAAPLPPGRPELRGGTPVLGTPMAIPSRGPQRTASGRYAAARPAAIFSTPPEQGNIFGGSSISEQSLDEVILSYLAEDLDGSAEK